MGRASKEITAQKIETLLEGISIGKSASKMCEVVGLSQTYFYRMLQNDTDLVEKYTRAREAQADYLFDEILSIVDEPAMMTASGTIDSGDVAHKRLRMDARKWHASKLAPKKYGDKLTLDADLKIADVTEEQINARLLELAGKAGIAGLAGGKGEKGEG